MNCLECYEQVQQLLDGEPTGPALEAHLSTCKGCREVHAAARALLHGLSQVEQPVIPHDLADTIVLSALRDRAARRRRRWLATSMAAAATIFALVAVWHSSNNMPVADAGLTATAEPKSPSLEENVQQAGQALADLTRRTAVDTLGTSRTFLPTVEMASTNETQLALPNVPAESRRAWSDAVEGVSAGLEPLATSARQAASFFRREVPLLNQDSGPGM